MPVNVQGICGDQFEAVRQAFSDNFASRGDIGASFAVTLEGETVIDLWGGFKDKEKTDPWEQDTLTNVFSTTKTMAALVALMLADREVIELSTPVARYWPEFSAGGKEKVTVAHVLSHAAGLPGLDEEVCEQDLYDHDKICALLAAQSPWWQPGTASGYHAITQGYLLGEIVQRVTGQTLGTFFAEEVAGPLGADFYIGVPAEKDTHISTLIPPENPDHHLLFGVPEPGTLQDRVKRSPMADSNWVRHEAWRRAELPAANGHSNARAVAEIHCILANGGVAGGKRFLSEEMCRRIFEVQQQGQDLVLGIPVKLGLGFGLNGEEAPVSPNPNTCYWGGWGGSIAVIDMDARMTISYVMNQMMHREENVPDPRVAALSVALWEGLAG
jgi:CubicO group peptidase (beta-lactamase class C family)